MTAKLRRAALYVIGIASAAGGAAPTTTGMPNPAPPVSTSAIAVDLEALQTLRKQGVFFPPDSSPPSTVTAFKSYLRNHDAYADYLTREEFLRFSQVQQEKYAGIGLELERNPHGEVICYPDRVGPAAKAGVAAGDRLVAVGGQSIEGWALPSVVATSAGSPGSALAIEVARGAVRRRFNVIRTQRSGPSVSAQHRGRATLMRIASFTPSTRQELEFELLHVKPQESLTLDLRGNRGGDLNAAMDCAMLFLNKGESVASVRRKDAVQPFVSSITGRWHARKALLWQDEETASAAEVFIAALTENRHGTSMGTKSFGKGTEQDLFVLGSGAALIVTTGFLVTPSGHEIDGQGIEPNRVLAPGTEPHIWR
jgi:carboxyl-terminal processing protease